MKRTKSKKTKPTLRCISGHPMLNLGLSLISVNRNKDIKAYNSLIQYSHDNIPMDVPRVHTYYPSEHI